MPGYYLKPTCRKHTAQGLICPECNLLLREPVQTEDGIRLCESCFQDILGYPNLRSSRTGITVTSKQCFRDKAVEKELQQLEILCENSGCPWEGKVIDYQAHVRVCCTYDFVVNCEDNVLSCDYCGEFTMRIILNEKGIFKCPKCGQENIVKKDHQADQHVIRLAHIVRNAVAGISERRKLCWIDVKLAAKQTLEVQLKAYLESHSSNLSYQGFTQIVLAEVDWSDYSSVSPLKGFLRVLQENAKIDLSQEISQVDDLLRALSTPLWFGLEKVQKECNNCPPIRIFSGYRSPSPQSPVGLCSDFQGLFGLVTPVMCTDSNYSLLPGMDTTKTNGDSRLRSIERTCEDLQRKFYESRRAQPVASYDGTFMWKIPDVCQRRKDAVYERTSLYSPPFYTSRNGYKMCMQAYLNGDGVGYKTHLSLLFVLMRGEFDALLQWPFEQEVSLSLVDQTHHENIVRTFRPEPESSSFRRPQTEMNVASGFPKFANLSVFDDPTYVRDDTMFVKCEVDTSSMFHP